MLRSLFAGVTGLQAHQIAMDVESNNIANVNTVGYKYSRANFSDLLAQTAQIATAPQGDLGGKNAVQVGLGTTISSVTRLMTQGSIQNTDKNTDVAIQGDGFFIVSSDAGSTYKYSRSGDFKFDAAGNFVDNNGFVVQGWVRDNETGKVDSTAPISNINIPPGLTTPAPNSNRFMNWIPTASAPTVSTVSKTRQMMTVRSFLTSFSTPAETPSTSKRDRGCGRVISPSTYRDTIAAPAAGALAFTVNGVSMSMAFTGTETASQAASAIAAKINANTATTGSAHHPIRPIRQFWCSPTTIPAGRPSRVKISILS
jgi:flagellar hook-basal body protein